MKDIKDIKDIKFENFGDIDTALVFMAGCAIRERIESIKKDKSINSELSTSINEDDFRTIRDFARIAAFAETKHLSLNSEEFNKLLKDKFNTLVNQAKREINHEKL